ncbi:MAG: hypothetical protein M0P71_11080 [Melioribacteraceae bacterium]|nr:hypothetical protein [Melioribacteraceae bacterium]
MLLIKFVKIFLLACFIFIIFGGNNFAQINDYVSNVTISPQREGLPIHIKADLRNSSSISDLTIAYRSFGMNEYIKSEMVLISDQAKATIPSDRVKAPFMEYYIIITLSDGNISYYPSEFSENESPLQISIETLSPKDSEIFILTPEKNERVNEKDFFVSVSLIGLPDKVDPKSTKLYIGDIDVSDKIVVAGDLVIFSGENNFGLIPLGSNSIKIEVYDSTGALYHTVQSQFELVSSEVAEAILSQFTYSGNIKGESRNENYNSNAVFYNNLTANFNGNYKDWSASAMFYLSSEEKKYLQPVNRFTFSIEKEDRFSLQAGDTYPRFPSLILDGKRVRGFNGTLDFGVFNLQASAGETLRKIEGKLIDTYSSKDAPLESNVIRIDSLKYSNPFGRVDLGTFKRNIVAIRPSFGSRENFQLGFSYLHSKDENGSIEFGARPQENLVFGSDLFVGLDNQRIVLTGEAAFSLINKDISGGSLTDTQIDSIFGAGSFIDIDPNDVKKVKDYLGKFITINQYIGPLNPQKFSSLAAEGAISLNYFNNNLKFSYIYRGNEFQSFGQNFLRTDVKGFNFSDRLRLLENQLFVSLGFELLSDNLQNTKIATTDYSTFSSSVSYFPRFNFPSVTVGYYRYDNNNGLNLLDPTFGKYAIDDISNRFTLNFGYKFTLEIPHSANLSFSTSSRDDNSLSNTDAKYNSVNLQFNSIWASDLSSIFSASYYSSEIALKEIDFFSISLGGKYLLLENKLQLSAVFSPTFGDIERQAFDLIASYNIVTNLDLIFQARYYRIPGRSNSSIIGVTAQFNI